MLVRSEFDDSHEWSATPSNPKLGCGKPTRYCAAGENVVAIGDTHRFGILLCDFEDFLPVGGIDVRGGISKHAEAVSSKAELA